MLFEEAAERYTDGRGGHAVLPVGLDERELAFG